jgi:hypothetical protein
MAINATQFLKGLSLEDFMKQYGTEEQCEQAFAQARCPNGFCCPRWAHTTAEVGYRFNRRFDLAAMVPRLAVAAAQTPPCSKRKIIGHFEEST